MHNKLLLIVMVAFCSAATGWFLACKEAPPAEGKPVLRVIEDVPLPGPAVRFDYQSLDVANGRLYLAHMNADHLVVFDVAKRRVVEDLEGFHRVHGVIAVPEIDRIFASITGDHEVAVVDRSTLKTIARVGYIKYPDGLAYALKVNRVSYPTSMETPTP